MTAPLDRTDFTILELLTKNGRASNKEIAAEAGVAPSSAHSRLRRLRDDGVLRGIHAEIAPAAAGVAIQALYMIELAKHDRDIVQTFIQEIMDVTEVVATYLVSGGFDVLVHVAVRDTDHLRDLAFDQFTRRTEVTRIETALIFDHVRKPGWPMLNAPAA